MQLGGRSLRLGLLTLSLTTCVGGQDGFEPLFDGRSLEGWVVKGNPAGWQVSGGVIRSEGQTGGDWLRSAQEYGDFILRVEWRVSPNGNSGVFIRAAESGNPWETGYEVQISNEPRDDLHCTGSLYGYVPVDPRPDESPNVWHTFEIHARGSLIAVYSDGLQCVNVDQSQVKGIETKPLRGYIGLQDSHSPEGNYIEYRKIEIKELG